MGGNQNVDVDAVTNVVRGCVDDLHLAHLGDLQVLEIVLPTNEASERSQQQLPLPTVVVVVDEPGALGRDVVVEVGTIDREATLEMTPHGTRPLVSVDRRDDRR